MSTPDPAYKHLFGPVPSRRLGLSLGVDLVPFKTCSFDCVYCQVGRTNPLTDETREYVPAEEVLDEFRHWLDGGGHADAVTLSGQGEPTLHRRFGFILAGIRHLLEARELPDNNLMRLCVLTNGSLLYRPEVRAGLAGADIVKVTFSAPDEETWRWMHGAVPNLHFADAVEGLRLLRRDFAGEIWLEVMVLDGLNATGAQMQAIAALARGFRPDRIQLNTVVRPPAQACARPVPRSVLEGFAGLFDPTAEVIGDYRGDRPAPCAPSDADILALLRRHPATAPQIANLFRLDPAEAADRLEALRRAGRVTPQQQGDQSWYVAVTPPAA